VDGYAHPQNVGKDNSLLSIFHYQI